jgi:hypothetical protein
MQPLHVDPVDLQLQRAYLLGLDHAVLQQHNRTRLNQCGGLEDSSFYGHPAAIIIKIFTF